MWILNAGNLGILSQGKHVRPKIGNREKQQGKHGKYPKKLGKQWVKHEQTYGEMRETLRELPLGGFLSHLVTNFQAALHCRIHPRMTVEYLF